MSITHDWCLLIFFNSSQIIEFICVRIHFVLFVRVNIRLSGMCEMCILSKIENLISQFEKENVDPNIILYRKRD
jgi:hypothetical protein